MKRTRILNPVLGLTLLAMLLVGRTGALYAAEAATEHPAAAIEGAKGEAATHGEGESEPQLIGPFSTGAIPALTSLVVFVCLLIVLGKFAWGPITAGLKAREDKIRKDIADAEAARTKAETTLKEYNGKLAEAESKVREMLAKAINDAEAAAATVRTRGQQEAEEAKEKALKDIETAKTAALREVYDQTAQLATSVAEKILRRNLNADDQRDLVNRSLEQMQSVNKN